MDISVIIPVYNSELILPTLANRLISVLEKISDKYEIILVNDGSKDQSWKVISQLANEYKKTIKGIDLMRNYGQHNALLCGIKASSYDIIITLDDDLQNPPEEIPKIIGKLKEGYDVVYGTPKKGEHGFFRNMASWITKLVLQNVMGSQIARNVSSYRAFKGQIRDAFQTYQCPFVSIDVLLTWGTTKFGAIQVDHKPRDIGKSNYTLRSLVIHALNMMTGFSTLPLQIASIIGFIFTFFGFGVLIYVLTIYIIYGRNVPGFAFLASIIAIFSGAQLFALGVIGEYLARIHFRSMGRPSSVIRQTLGFSPNDNNL